jgi:hypothetical protein
MPMVVRSRHIFIYVALLVAFVVAIQLGAFAARENPWAKLCKRLEMLSWDKQRPA